MPDSISEKIKQIGPTSVGSPRAVLEQALDAVVAIDADGIVLEWNRQAELIFERTREEMLGKQMADHIIPLVHREGHRRGMKHFNATGVGPILNERIEITALRRNGAEFPVELTIIPVQVGSAHVFYSFIRDITALKNAEARLLAAKSELESAVLVRTAELHHEKSFLNAVLETMESSIVVCNAHGELTLFNQASRDFHGLDAMKIPPEQWAEQYDLFEADGQTPLRKERIPLFLALNGQEIRGIELVVAPKAGKRRTLLANGRPIRNERGEIVGAVIIQEDITLRKAAEQELILSDVILRQLPDAVIVTDLDGKITRWTGNAAKIFGYVEDEAVGQSLGMLHRLENPSQEAGSSSKEFSCLRKDGTRIPVETTTRLARDSSGCPVYLVGIHKDISERKKLEEDRYQLIREQTARREAEKVAENYRLLAESLPQLAWIAHPDGSIFWYNQRWYSYTGTTAADMEGWGWQKVHDPAELPGVLEKWKLSIQTGQDFEMEFPLRGADGRFRWFLTRVIPFRDETGKIARWFGANTDIDGQRRVRVTQSFLSEASSVLFSSLDYKKTLQAVALLAVPRLADWCSIDVVREDGPHTVAVGHEDPAMMALATELSRRFPPDWKAATGAPAVIRTGQSELYPVVTEEMLVEAIRDSDHLQILRDLKMCSAVIVPLQAHGKTLGALTLISTRPGRHFGPEDQEVAEELGRRAGMAIDNSTLFQQAQNAIAARDEFLSIASHELKTPITALKLQTQLYRRRLAKGDPSFLDPGAITKLVETSDRQTERLTRLVDDMLDISRIAHGKLEIEPEKVDLAMLVREVVDRFDLQLKSGGCSYHLNLQSAVLGNWDRFRIEQVITNLVTNAIKYSSGSAVEFSVFVQGAQAILRVSDQGMGIAPENLERIFQRFERAISSTKISGLGLGLYISRQIVEAHGGTIRVESTLGKGSVFTVELPL